MAAQLERTSAADIAVKTQQALGLKLSLSTVTRLVRKKRLQHMTVKVKPMLTDSQKQVRVRYVKWDPQERALLMVQSHDHR